MQPTFLPWAGYFRLMQEADQFVFLDDVQLSRQSWQTRNRVLIGGEIHWVVVPVSHKVLEQTIKETEISNAARWRGKLGRSLRQSYARHPAIVDLEELIVRLELGTQQRLSDINIDLISYCSERFGIDTPRHRAAEMAISGEQRTARLIEFCELLGCDTYLSPPGAAEYLEADGFKEMGAVQLEYANYDPPTYPQLGRVEFVSHLSIADVIANLGWDGAARYIKMPWTHS